MRATKLIEIVGATAIIAFAVKGILSEYGYVQKFDADSLYAFTYLGFTMSIYLFFYKLISILNNKTENDP